MIEYEDTEDIDLLGIGANEKMLEVIGEMGLPLVTQGVVKGMNAAILGESHRRGIDVMSIMAEADPRFPDARAAAAIIEKVNHLLPMTELDHEPLLEEAAELEEQLKGMISSAQTESKSQSSGSPNSMLYG